MHAAWAYVAALPSLHTLVLSGNKFEGGVPKQWGASAIQTGLAALTQLDLSMCQLEGTLPAGWATGLPLLHLNLSGNHLTGQPPGMCLFRLPRV